jgi:hypothetical protein
MKYCRIILAAAVMMLFSLECGAQVLPGSAVPASRGGTGESATPSASPKATGSRVVPSAGTVVNTRTLTITGPPSASLPFTPVAVGTKTLTITGPAPGGAFSPVGIRTQTLTITGGSGGK